MNLPPISTFTTGSVSLRPERIERGTTSGGSGADGFGDLVTSALDSVNKSQNNADQLANKAALGGVSDPQEYMIAATEASLSTELTVAVRNRAVEAFNDIMRMTV
jgi:flagellar hook-basal body complex protein FliE